MTGLELTIAKKLAAGPAWKRSFQVAMPAVDRMISRGDVEAVAPPGGTGKNMIALTERGRTALAKARSA